MLTYKKNNCLANEQIVKQVNKLIDVIKITDLTDRNHIERELLLISA